MFALAILASSRASRVLKVGRQPSSRWPIRPYPFPLKYSSNDEETNMISPDFLKHLVDAAEKELSRPFYPRYFPRNAEESTIDPDNFPPLVGIAVDIVGGIIIDKLIDRLHRNSANAEEALDIDYDNIPWGPIIKGAGKIIGKAGLEELVKWAAGKILPNNSVSDSMYQPYRLYLNAEEESDIDYDNIPWGPIIKGAGKIIGEAGLKELVKWAAGKILPNDSVSNSFTPYFPRRPLWKDY
ncbi:hypothetical protein TVAG_608090 [Trichomonas vaginalis G3]|uniref:Uncharacterized protein n=1 Tax=Trichomonas vaginalis (strain ATCC PRA-98 / G3) TaxID=412133 RepID=A2GJV2_TRIV3|nr:hypothetical protein TVAGG3_0219960 [Trichomonas vaginalis G3]EAX82566.1 hypothetical protein TVAG_608090 [Trichomonas vaginalis G3]KAI5551848.1 hypothetical protein TVAGG3_0219960 [Trichomonas vaginalis G3]|eukprot:XP_001295496.1 hypothetical protein [Trichomonas vaginalis G3]